MPQSNTTEPEPYRNNSYRNSQGGKGANEESSGSRPSGGCGSRMYTRPKQVLGHLKPVRFEMPGYVVIYAV